MPTTRIALGVGALVLVGMGIYMLFPRQERITNYPSSGTDIIAFGDSLIVGSGASTGDKSFVALLSREVNLPIVNLGVSGDTTAMGLARVSALDAYRPKVVILLLGGNDHLKRVSIDETFTNLAALINNFHARGATVLLLGVKGSLLGDAFAGRFETLHQQYHTAFVPNVLDGLFGDPTYMNDSIHPNDLGNAEIAKRVAPVLKRLLD